MNGMERADELGEGGVHPGGPYHLRMDDDFRQLTFAESQIELALPDGARIVDLSVEGERVTRLVVLNVSGVALREALSGFSPSESALWPGWVSVRIAGLSPGYDVALVTAGSDLVSMN